jgi:hypothetical protein
MNSSNKKRRKNDDAGNGGDYSYPRPPIQVHQMTALYFVGLGGGGNNGCGTQTIKVG